MLFDKDENNFLQLSPTEHEESFSVMDGVHRFARLTANASVPSLFF